MKNYVKFLIFFSYVSIFSQTEKETVNVFFSNEKATCKIDVEQTHKNKKGLDFIEKYKKEYFKNKIVFNICDEKFIFDFNKQKKDTCSIKNLKKINIKNLDYLKKKYKNGKEFKHHTFKQINIIEKISDNKIVKYYSVYWKGEWSIE